MEKELLEKAKWNLPIVADSGWWVYADECC